MPRFILIFFFLVPILAQAQSDTTRPADSAAATVVEKKNPGFVMHKSPTLALVCGIVPGGGQLYTEQYWKIPLFAIPIAALVGAGVYNNSLYNDYADQVRAATPGTFEYSLARSRRELYRDRSELSFAVAGGIYVLSLIDAYVGAHLYDFDVSDTLSSIYIYPDVEHNGLGLGVRW